MNIAIFPVVAYLMCGECLAVTRKDQALAKEFLFDFGYTDSLSPNKQTLIDALNVFRNDYGLDTVGELQDADVEMIKTPKCATPTRAEQPIRIEIDTQDIFNKPFEIPTEDIVVPDEKTKGKTRKKMFNKMRKEKQRLKKLLQKQLRKQKQFVKKQQRIAKKLAKQAKKSKRETAEEVLGIARSKRQVVHGHDHSLFQCYANPARPMTWCIANCLSNFCNIDEMRKAVGVVFDWWSAEINLSFEEVRCPGKTGFWGDDCGDANVCASADFVIAFTNIDGPSAVLALACVLSTDYDQPYCPKPGYVWLDAAEGSCADGSSRWKLGDCPYNCGWSYFIVVAHEIGHVLGFEHETITDCNRSIMNPIYQCLTDDAEIAECTEDQLLGCYDQGLCNPKTKDRADPQMTWCLANCLCDGTDGGFCDIQNMREEINKAMQWWAARTGTVISEICCPGGSGEFWKDDCNDVNVCLSADIVISFNKALDGPGSELVLLCPYGQTLDPTSGCSQPGIMFFDSSEGACPDGSSKWKLRAEECPATTCPGSASFYHQLLRSIGKIAGFSDVPNAAPCSNSVMDPVVSCRTDQPFMDTCLQSQITARGGIKPFPTAP